MCHSNEKNLFCSLLHYESDTSNGELIEENSEEEAGKKLTEVYGVEESAITDDVFLGLNNESNTTLPITESVILARKLEQDTLYLRAAKQWGVILNEHPDNAEYIVDQRKRCITLSNNHHQYRLYLYKIQTDLSAVYKEVSRAYDRLGMKLG
ncbi:PerC family transcriptional regulator [Photorhabdus luminescens]|uniref:Uncharacterized protein n=1 Tax=Photorhabdus luminescens subsp. mexicana TaxID=2100167 RepID=A0A4V2X5F1_PHOLU|nr:PerC family transcriptional regulator [Photorhabdus luminescens]TDB47925.1 hypothetical protein C5468_17785 [Photorhabdus luminescens subsp. mexicana]